MRRIPRRRFGWAVGAVLVPVAALAGTMDRLKGVSQHAQKQAGEGPEHLWVGVGIFAVLAVVVALAAWWTLSQKKR